ncbi:electron transfer flavoprotein subunit alpha/FixB family protein [Salinisphaera sp. USBA-960]|nr:electron transfer flavoprotein subunit alpha/FixB family protein [Salifodinibacter halophilus]NNC26905.1 electron transfer flavoprotein subunit alpha/FixB family protein [Salifodinibacter halophilus]
MSSRNRRRAPHASGNKRRDPRTERSMVRSPSAVTGSTGPTGRRRFNPRVLRGQLADNGRRRLDRSGRGQTMVAMGSAATTAGAAEPQPIIVDDPARFVLAVPDCADGRPSSHDRDILGAARTLADTVDATGAVVALDFGGRASLGIHGADRVIDATTLGADYSPEARVDWVIAAIDALHPAHVVFPDAGINGGDLARRVAAKRAYKLATHCQRVKGDVVISRGDGAKSETHLEPPPLLAIDAEGADPVAGAPREGRAVEIDAPATPSAVRDLGPVAVDPASIPLAETDFILAAGNGVTDWETFHAVASALGASEGASRVVCDAGDMPRDRQVGASGTLVCPRCYVAIGISGAPQHLQGITEVENVVAVDMQGNTPMQKRADLSVVGDAKAIMQALLNRLGAKSDAA